MLHLKRFLQLIIILLLLPTLSFAQKSFSFSLPTTARTSAGVYGNDGTLIKTLWNGVSYDAGTYIKTWDGKDENGTTVNGQFHVKFISNNVKYEWEGTVGNNSTAVTGKKKHRCFQGMYGMASAGNYVYYCTNYNEGWCSSIKFHNATPLEAQRILEDFTTSQEISAVTTDGNYVYWGGVDPFNPNNSFVHATRTSDDKEVNNFKNGKTLKTKLGRTYLSAIDNFYSPASEVSAMAVQKKGNYLFVARKLANTVRVVDKTTGAHIRELTFSSPRGLAVDGNDNLWVIHGKNSVQRFSVLSNGTLSNATLNLSGLLDPLAIAVSPDNSTVAICDGGTSEQVKGFSNSNGGAIWILGQAGGYTKDPNVNENKFYFYDRNHGKDNSFRTFITFVSDGSFWVGDGGNYRALHYNANRSFKEKLMYLPHSYSIAVDRNDPTKVFNEYMEYKIDYSKPLAPNNGSWVLVRNYRATLPQNYHADFIKNVFRSLITLNNGRTYATLTKPSGDQKTTLVELPLNAPMRFTGVEFGANEHPLIETTGDLKRYSNGGIGKSATFSSCKFKGFDNSNNPIWEAPVILSTISTVKGTDPVDYGGAQMGQITKSGLLITFDKEGAQLGRGIGYHLGAIKPGENKFTWKTSKATSTSYSGDFPKDGGFDIGNSVNAPGCAGGVNVVDNNVIWNYHGEFWKNSQTNFWNHFSDKGLLIGQFGKWKTDFTASAPAEVSGNTMSGAVVKGPDGNLYVYHNDESIHAGVHRWKISNLNSISEQTINFGNTSFTPPPTISADDNANTLSASHTLGNSEILVSINNGPFQAYSGTINVGNSDRAIGYWKFKIKSATNRSESSVIYSPDFTSSLCPETGKILRESWANVIGYLVSEIPVNTSPTSSQFLTSFEFTSANGHTYASRVRGYICPPTTGNYTFWISGDNSAELWLSPDSDPAKKTKIAYTKSFTALQQWDKYPSQKSVSIHLQSGNKYYIEALQKGDNNNDHLSVGWEAPDGTLEQPLLAKHLIPFSSSSFTSAPTVSADDKANTLSASHTLGNSEILVSVNNGSFQAYKGTINVGNIARAVGYWKFKIRSATGRSESSVVNSPAFTTASTTDGTDGNSTSLCSGTGNILRENWANVQGYSVAEIPVNTTPTSTQILTSFEFTSANGNTHASRLRGYICPPATGNYTFWISGDNSAELWLSTNTDPARTVKIAYTDKYTGFQEWEKYPTQKSISIYLQSGNRYYIEALQKGDNHNDHLSVGWRTPDGALERPLQGNHIIPFSSSSFTSPPTVSADDKANTLSASHSLGNSEILVSINNGSFQAYTGTINVGNNARAVSYWKFKIRSATGRSESSVVNSPAFTTASTTDGTYGNSTSLCSGTGKILRENWANVQGYSVAEIPVNTSPTSTQFLTSFEFTSANGNTHASRLRGYICPPVTGNYTFWISGDNSAELWLSTNTEPERKVKIAYTNNFTRLQEWEKSPTQKSISIYLQSGNRYYIEALQKGDNHNDHLSVGWKTPEGTLERPLQGNRLIPFSPPASARFAESEDEIAIEEREVLSVFPNPFSSETTVAINLENASFLKLEIFDLNGNLISDLSDEVIASAGNSKSIRISSTKMNAGVYILKLSTSTKIYNRRIILIR